MNFVTEYLVIKQHLLALKRFQGQIEEAQPPDGLALAAMALVALAIFALATIS